jgi:hypothetical protein
MNKDYFKPKDPYKPRIWENKNYIFHDEINNDNINKIFSIFLTSSFDDIILEFNKDNILNYRTEEGKTLIIAVLQNGELSELQKKQIIEKLIHLRVSINAKDQYNKTALHIACQSGFNSIIQLLVDKKALKNELDNDGNAPVHYYIEQFIKDCADTDVYNKNDYTINPVKKKYSEIINNLFNVEIITILEEEGKKERCKDKINELIKLIKFFEIKKINDEYESFEENTKFNLLGSGDIVDADINNKIFKGFIQLKNNIYKIFEEKNKIEQIDDKQIKSELIENEKNLVIDIKEKDDRISDSIESVEKKIDKMSTLFNTITETLLLLIYIKKTLPFSIRMYKNECKINIAENSKVILNKIKEILETEKVNYVLTRLEESSDLTNFENNYNNILKYKSYIQKAEEEIIICSDLKKKVTPEKKVTPDAKRKILQIAKTLTGNTLEILQDIAFTDLVFRDIMPDVRRNHGAVSALDIDDVNIDIEVVFKIIVCNFELLSKLGLPSTYINIFNIFNNCKRFVEEYLELKNNRTNDLKENLLNSLTLNNYIRELPYKFFHSLPYRSVMCASAATDLLLLYHHSNDVINNKPNDNYKNTKESVLAAANAVYCFSKAISRYYYFIPEVNNIRNQAKILVDQGTIDDGLNLIGKALGSYNDIKTMYNAVYVGQLYLNSRALPAQINIVEQTWIKIIAIIFELLNLDNGMNPDRRETIRQATSQHLPNYTNNLNIILQFGLGDLPNLLVGIDRLQNFSDKEKMIFQAAVWCLFHICIRIRVSYQRYNRDNLNEDLIRMVNLFVKILPAAIIAAYVTNNVYELYTTYIIPVNPFGPSNISAAVGIGKNIGCEALKRRVNNENFISELSAVFDSKATLSSILNLQNFNLQIINAMAQELNFNIANATELQDCLYTFFDIITNLFTNGHQYNYATNSTTIQKAKIISAAQEALYLAVPLYESEYCTALNQNRSNYMLDYLITAMISSAGYNHDTVQYYLQQPVVNKNPLQHPQPLQGVQYIDDVILQIINVYLRGNQVVESVINDNVLINICGQLQQLQRPQLQLQALLNNDDKISLYLSSLLEYLLKNIITQIDRLPKQYHHDHAMVLRDSIYQIRDILKQLSFFNKKLFIDPLEINNEQYLALMDSVQYYYICIGNSAVARINLGQKSLSLDTIMNSNQLGNNIFPAPAPAPGQRFPNNITKSLTSALDAKDKNSISSQLLSSLEQIYDTAVTEPAGGNDPYTGRGVVASITVFGYDSVYLPIILSNQAFENWNISTENKTSIQNLEKVTVALQPLFTKIESIRETDYNEENISIENTDFENEKKEIFKLYMINFPDINNLLYYNHKQLFEVQQFTEDNKLYIFDNISSQYFKRFDPCDVIIKKDNDNDNDNVSKPIRFHDDDDVDVHEEADNKNIFIKCSSYKYFNIHFIFELINKYLEDIEDINLPKDVEDDQYYEYISYSTIIKIYSNYEKIICIINNLNIIYNKRDIINKDFEDLVKFRENLINKNYLNYEIDLPSIDFTSERRKKKYKIIQKGGDPNYYIDLIKKIESKDYKEIVLNNFNEIYDNFMEIFRYYNQIIENINKIYSLRFFKSFKNGALNIPTYINKFMLLNEFPKSLKEYYNKFFNKKKINYDEIKKLFLQLNDFNYNEIYNENDDLKLHINKYSYRVPNVIEYRKGCILYVLYQLPAIDDPLVVKKDDNMNISDNNRFKLGYLSKLNDDYEEIIFKKNKIYINKYGSKIDEDHYGKYKYINNNYNEKHIIILAIYYYHLYMNEILNKCKESLELEGSNIFENIKKKFEKKYSNTDRDSKKIIKNLEKIIKNKEDYTKLLELKFYKIMKIYINHLSNMETNKILFTLFKGSEDFDKISELVKEYFDSAEEEKADYLEDQVKDLLNDDLIYVIDIFNEVDDREFSTKIIDKRCLNKTCLEKIKDFKFNLRLPDKNGNTVIHRLVDQLNVTGIDHLLNPNMKGDPAITTYGNNNKQKPINYLLNIFKITTNLYRKEEVELRVDELALEVDQLIINQKKDISIEIKLEWTKKDTKVIFYSCLNQFNEYLWLKLYEFKNNISIDNITKLKDIIGVMNNSVVNENLLIKGIDEKEIREKLNKIFNKSNIKHKLEGEFDIKKCDNLSNLENALKNFEKLQTEKIFDKDDIRTKIKEIKKQIDEKKNEKSKIDEIKILFNKSQDDKVDKIMNVLIKYKDNLIKNFNLNMVEFTKLSKELEEDYLKILHILYEFKSENNDIYICDFNYKLICLNINEINKEENKDNKIVYKKYFEDHINPIFEDFNDLEKKEDYNMNYVNNEILNIIYVNIVYTISYEIYNSILLYLFEKYNAVSLKDKDRTQNKNLIFKNLKLLLKNKIFDKLEIKNEDKIYESHEFYKDLIENTFINLFNKNLEEEDKKIMEQIIESYSIILENIASKFYNEIKEYLTNQRKIVLLLQIYDKLDLYEKMIK